MTLYSYYYWKADFYSTDCRVCKTA